VIRVNKWRAARHGLEADIIGDDHGAQVPVRRAVRELVDQLSPVAARLGCLDELTSLLGTLEQGASYMRQRAIVAAGGSLADVVDSLVEEMATQRPGGR
jgi:carboxylate-amine ligase